MGIDARGFSRGLGILWDISRVILSGFQGTRYTLLADFKVVGFPIQGMMTNVYGPQVEGDKREFFGSLRSVGLLLLAVQYIIFQHKTYKTTS